jgi:hypothetical protein
MGHRKGGRTDSLTPTDFRGSGGADKRQEPRVTTEKTISILTYDRNGNAHFEKAKMVDCSIHGIAIVTSLQFDPNEWFLTKLRISSRTVLSAYISRHVVQQVDKYRIGAEFAGLISAADEDPDAILRALVDEASTI